jgi:hypothetical protein
MAAPNIVNVATITGKTVYLDLSTTSVTSLVSNAASSNKVFKLNNIFVSNINGTSAADITVSYHTAAAAGGTAFKIVSTVSVPADSTLVVLDKSGSIYLEENTSVSVQAGTAGFLQVVASYEDIS